LVITYLFSTFLAAQSLPVDSLAMGVLLADSAIAESEAALPLTRKADRGRRDSLFRVAEAKARRAVALAPRDARTLFALGLVLGNTAMTRGLRDRLRYAKEVYDLAERALGANSSHGGAHHLLGRWHYEVLQLSGFQRFLARTLLGGGVLGKARWEEARAHLARAVVLDSTRIYHRLDYARVLWAMNQRDAARAELLRIEGLPNRVPLDTMYRREAAELMRTVTGDR
jgi:hypothetical protein